jgi:small subunit ribosomal protein S4
VNGRKVNIPSYLIKTGDVVEVKDKSRKIQAISDAQDAVVRRGIPQWLDLEKENFKGIIKGYPEREEITMPIQEQLIVELYTK